MKENCKTCGSRTEAMYQLNGGLFCENHAQAALSSEKISASLEALKGKWASMRRNHQVMNKIFS